MLDDKSCVSLWYRITFGRKLNLKNPQLFSEKLQWLKLFGYKDAYSKLVDKYAVKEYVRSIIGDDYVIPTLGVWDTAEEIEWNKLPEQFVLKTTHGCGGKGVIVVKDKKVLSPQEIQAITKQLSKEMKRDSFRMLREKPYKNVPKRIIAEQYIEDKNGVLIDYKFDCFNGVAEDVMICLDRQLHDVKFFFFDRQWNYLRYDKRSLSMPKDFSIERPKGIDEMFNIASRLSQGLPYARIDLYNADGKIYFGEITLYPSSGLDDTFLPLLEETFGDRIKLS